MMNTLSAGLGERTPSEVDFTGTVASAPRFFSSALTHRTHEAFDVRSDDGHRVEIVDNVTLAPRLPVVVGDRVAVRGELVPESRYGPLVHWTHRDPSGRHADGYIDYHGRRYA